MFELFRAIASIFLPERIIIEGDVVTVRFMGEKKHSQNLSELTSFVFFKHNDFTGEKMLGVTTNQYVVHDYFGGRIGFRALLENVINRATLLDDD